MISKLNNQLSYKNDTYFQINIYFIPFILVLFKHEQMINNKFHNFNYNYNLYLIMTHLIKLNRIHSIYI